ncbi:MAG TPA: nucleotidyltransferase family protein, partial [Flavobacteriaceae bacterium]|nr:nucleotidyltransferase family protein [Flavobacteriaceae bacterium]
AGGKSKRMGLPKGLLKYNKTYWLLEQLNRIEKVTNEVYIGLGFDANLYFKAIPWLKQATNKTTIYKNLKVNVVVNTSPEKGSFSTLKTVLQQISETNDILINLIDVPFPKLKSLKKIIAQKNTVVIPSFIDYNGHPIKISHKFCNTLLEINENSSEARLDFQIKKLSETEITYVPVKDNSVVKNLNTPLQWKYFLKENLIE